MSGLTKNFTARFACMYLRPHFFKFYTRKRELDTGN
ncbi:MAG: hypothetical protein ACXV5I_07130 [Halobacteriota archaeon]